MSLNFNFNLNSSKPSQLKKIKSNKNISILKILLFFSLILAGGLSGGLSYYFLNSYQLKIYKQQFLTKISDHYNSFSHLLLFQLQLNLQFGVMMGLHCPNINDWPNCSLSSRELKLRTRSLLSLSEVSEFVMTPIVIPSKRKSFENYASNYFKNEEKYQNKTDIHSQIYEFSSSSNHQPFSSPNHTNSSLSQHDFVVPVLFSSSSQDEQYLLFNIYSDPQLRHNIDSIYDCVNKTMRTSEGNIQNECSKTLDLPSPEYFSMITTPIFADDDTTNKTVVGFSGAVFSWKLALSKLISSDFSFQCTIQSSSSSSSSSHSFNIHNGEINEIENIQENKDFHELKTIYHFTSVNSMESYSITYYPSNQSLPSQVIAIITCVGCIGITLIISIIFLIFIQLINREKIETNMLLDSKRTFVRFISHEIRLLF